MQQQERRVTILEVARAAGVSKSTVSVVLNGRAGPVRISDATRAAVLDVAARLGYTPNHAARSLRRRRTNIITLLVLDLSNQYFTDIAAAAREVAEARGYEVNVVDAGAVEAELRALGHLRGGSSDGAIVATGRHSERGAAIDALRDLVRRGLPAVVVIDQSPDPAIPAIRIDDEAGAYEATRHLLRLGHRRIAHLTFASGEGLETTQRSEGERYRGYRRALAEAGVALDPAWLFAGEPTMAGGRQLMHALLALGPDRPTAAFVFNDNMAIGALRALHEAGVAVPAGMALVGFDGIGLGAFTAPALTTIDHPRRELGRRAAETLFGLLEGRPPADRDLVLPVRLVVRESCRAATAAPADG